METFKRFVGAHLLWALVLLLAVLFFAFFTPKSLSAENGRIITVYYDGKERTIVTDATTVDEALRRAEVTITEHDAVEPSLHTELIAHSYNVNVYRGRPVTVVDGNKKFEIMSPHTSGRKIAEAAGLRVNPEDEFNLTRIDDFLQENGVGLKLDIDRAIPVTFTLYGDVVPNAHTQATTVAEFLKEKKVTLHEKDGVLPGLDAQIVAGMTISVFRENSQTIREEKEIPFETERIQNADHPVGYRQIQTPGVKGKKTVIFQIEQRDGKEVSRKEIQSVVISEPKKQIEVVGVKSNIGSIGEALAKLRQCEAGGVYTRNSGNGYYGAYQYDISTWANYGGYRLASDAPPAVQDQKAVETYNRRGWTPWPSCSRKLGLQDIYR